MSTTWRRGIFFYRTSARGCFWVLRLFSFRIEEGRRTFEKKKKKKEIFQRDIKENSNNLVQSQEQITVSGIPPVNVRAVPVKVEYRTKTAAVENGPLMKSWN